ncbi:hypothetical protein [Burkholderia cenocepacia]|uniref:hypothetical protein n=1 Tax=Burkholderia cenocepacia TaxID=95486 RepID=UPI002AB07A77|nr:hypothetical protein [Burkholderia cenocepacia]
MSASIPSPLLGGRCVATRNNCVGVPACTLQAGSFYGVVVARFGDETSAKTARQGFRSNGNFNLPFVRPHNANTRCANQRFRYSGKP